MADEQTSPDEALDALLPLPERTGELADDHTEAFRRALALRHDAGRLLSATVRGMRSAGLSWNEIVSRTGEKRTNIRRWADEPPEK